MTQGFEADANPSIKSSWDWHEFQVALLHEERGRVLQMFQTNVTIIVERRRDAQFVGFSRFEVEDFFDIQLGHLKLLTMFDLLATTEAILRINFKDRVKARKKDRLSKGFRKLQKAGGDKIRLDEDILTVMKEEGVRANVIADFRSVLKLRHWLAHGRHWNPKIGRGYEPGDVFDIAKALIDSMPL